MKAPGPGAMTNGQEFEPADLDGVQSEAGVDGHHGPETVYLHMFGTLRTKKYPFSPKHMYSVLKGHVESYMVSTNFVIDRELL